MRSETVVCLYIRLRWKPSVANDSWALQAGHLRRPILRPSWPHLSGFHNLSYWMFCALSVDWFWHWRAGVGGPKPWKLRLCRRRSHKCSSDWMPGATGAKQASAGRRLSPSTVSSEHQNKRQRYWNWVAAASLSYTWTLRKQHRDECRLNSSLDVVFFYCLLYKLYHLLKVPESLAVLCAPKDFVMLKTAFCSSQCLDDVCCLTA